MDRNTRLNKLKSYVDKQGFVTIKEVADAIGISEATVRRDVSILDEYGDLKKVSGGVISLSQNIAKEPSLVVKSMTNIEEKERIARAALKYVNDNDQIILDAGTTTLALAQFLDTFNRLTVATYDMQIAAVLSRFTGTEVVLAGGVLRRNYGSFYGCFTENTFREIHVSRAFMGCDAVSVDNGIMSYTCDDIGVKRQIIKSADEVILLCDHSKINLKTFMSVAPIGIVSRIISGRELSDKDASEIENAGITLELV